MQSWTCEHSAAVPPMFPAEGNRNMRRIPISEGKHCEEIFKGIRCFWSGDNLLGPGPLKVIESTCKNLTFDAFCVLSSFFERGIPGIPFCGTRSTCFPVTFIQNKCKFINFLTISKSNQHLILDDSPSGEKLTFNWSHGENWWGVIKRLNWTCIPGREIE